MRTLTLTPPTIITVRAVVIWTLRTIAVFLVFRGGYFVTQRLVFSLFAGQDAAWRVWTEVGNTSHRGSTGISMLIFGAALAAGSNLIAGWMTPVPSEGCPRCGYARDASVDDQSRCPECGLPGVNASSADA